MHRNAIIALNVVLLHVAGLWALQNGLLRRTIEIIVPAQIISAMSPQPAAPPPPPQPAHRPTPATRAPVPAPAPAPAPPQPAPSPLAVEPVAPVAAPAPAPPPVAPAAAPPATLELPSSSATYLQNPKPPYPALSRRLGEQGTVVLRVLIGADGQAQRAEIRSSSGFARLDQAALETVLRWRYVPGRRGGVPESMWFNVPINFVLE